MTRALSSILLLLVVGTIVPAGAQPLDLASGGPVTVTARDGIDWQQEARVVIARGDARAVRENVTVTADRLIAHYRPKAAATPGQPGTGQPAATQASAKTPADTPANTPANTGPGGADTGGNEIYQLEAIGNVRIFTPTDVATGDHAIYDMDQAVLVLTGRNLKLTRPAEVITARDSLEYWSQAHRAVARGNAVVVTTDAREVRGDTLVAYTAPPADAAKPAGTVSAKPVPAAAKPGDDPLAASGQDREGRGVRQRAGADRDRYRHRRPRRLCARYRHRAARRIGSHHARPEPAQRPGGRGRSEDRHLSSDRHRRPGARAGDAEATARIRKAPDSGKSPSGKGSDSAERSCSTQRDPP